MIVDIDKIIVRDRIRKDYGDIQELADDIKSNGLINPPVVNRDYVLLAGERRLKACKSLGWNQIEVHVMDTRDAEHELNVEISENDVRKGFSKAERVDYMKRLLRIEREKAEKRMQAGVNPVPNSAQGGKTRDIVAERFGIGHDTMRREIAIAENRDLLDPSDFADWDEGKLSTNKAFQKLKRQLAEKDRIISDLENQGKVEVFPADYLQLQKDLKDAKRQASAYRQDLKNEQKRFNEKARENVRLRDEVEDLKRQTISEQNMADLNGSALTFAMECRGFLQTMGGFTFVAEHLAELNEKERKGYIVAAKAMRDWAEILLSTIEKNEEELYGSY